MMLSDYHRVRAAEVESWNRGRLRHDAGVEFVATVESLLPAHDEKWRPDKYIDFTREPWFENVLQICALYQAGTEAQRTWLRSRIDRKTSGKFGIFGMRAAILGAREHSPDLARAGLLAFAIKDLVDCDIRDVLIGFTLVCHCVRLSGADLPSLLREIAPLAGAATEILYKEWADKYPNISGIGAMGWRQVETEQGVGFRLG